MTQLAISGVSERDIDFLLLEEFYSSGEFLSWFLGRLGLSDPPTLVSLAHSVSTSTGESDIELAVKCTDRLHMLLVENKISAILQPRQPERYRERAKRYVQERQCDECRTVLVAPASYLGHDPTSLGFDATVTYQALIQYFETHEDLHNRGRFKRTLLSSAVNRGSTGWTLVPDETTTDFWRRYWELARVLAPELRMPRPGEKPATSSFIQFRPLGLPKGVALLHKVPYGNVDIQFSGKAKEIADLEQRYATLLEPGMAIEPAAKSAVIRLSVPQIDMSAPFAISEPAVREGIWAAKLLLTWYKHIQP